MMNLEKGYKQTEVGILPEDWKVIRIDKVCKLINGRGFKPFEWKDRGLPIIRIQNLNGSEDYNYYDGIYDKKIEVENGQLLFAWSGSRGTSFGPHIWNGSKGLLNYHTWKVNVFPDRIDKEYFLHSLKGITKQIEKSAHGASALVHTQKWEMEAYLFPKPESIKEQTAIASALSDMDQLIAKTEQLIEKKKAIKQGVMQELLKPKEGWVVKKLGMIAEVTMGQSPLSEYYNSKGIGLPLIQGNADVKDRKTIVRFFTSVITKQAKRGDIIMTVRAPVGEVSKAEFDCCLGRGVCSLKFKNDFLFHYLIFLEKSWAKLSTGSTFDSVNSKQVKELDIPIPKLDEEQNQIAEILSKIDEEIEKLEGKLKKCQKVKQGTMQALLTGKIRLL
jgi:type I restriction enzyme S subunit